MGVGRWEGICVCAVYYLHMLPGGLVIMLQIYCMFTLHLPIHGSDNDQHLGEIQ